MKNEQINRESGTTVSLSESEMSAASDRLSTLSRADAQREFYSYAREADEKFCAERGIEDYDPNNGKFGPFEAIARGETIDLNKFDQKDQEGLESFQKACIALNEAEKSHTRDKDAKSAVAWSGLAFDAFAGAVGIAVFFTAAPEAVLFAAAAAAGVGALQAVRVAMKDNIQTSPEKLKHDIEKKREELKKILDEKKGIAPKDGENQQNVDGKGEQEQKESQEKKKGNSLTGMGAAADVVAAVAVIAVTVLASEAIVVLATIATVAAVAGAVNAYSAIQESRENRIEKQELKELQKEIQKAKNPEKSQGLTKDNLAELQNMHDTSKNTSNVKSEASTDISSDLSERSSISSERSSVSSESERPTEVMIDPTAQAQFQASEIVKTEMAGINSSVDSSGNAVAAQDSSVSQVKDSKATNKTGSKKPITSASPTDIAAHATTGKNTGHTV